MRPLIVVLGGLMVLSALGLAFQKLSRNEVCLINEEIYNPSTLTLYEKHFTDYLGTDAGADWPEFSTSLQSYLSEAYRSCISVDEKTKDCVREGISKVQDILQNENRETPKEQWQALLSLEPPRFCLEKNKAEKTAESQKIIWISGSNKDYVKARRVIKTSVETHTASTSLEGLDARRMYNYGLVELLDNRLEEARAHIKESLNREPKSFQNYYVMALIELRTQNFEAALASLETAKAHLSSDSEPALLPQIKIEWAQSSALRGLRRYEEADDLLEKIIRKTIENLGENHFFLGDLYLEQAWVRSDRRGYGQAQKLLRKTFRIWKQHYEENHPKMLDAYIAMGLAQVEGDLAEEAIETLQKAQSINEILGNTEQRKLEIQFILALAYADRDRYLDRAIELAGRTLYELRQSDLKLPYLEVRIQRWLEAI